MPQQIHQRGPSPGGVWNLRGSFRVMFHCVKLNLVTLKSCEKLFVLTVVMKCLFPDILTRNEMKSFKVPAAIP